MGNVIGMAEKVDDDPLICSICLDSYKRPKLLPCFHTFCQACLERLGDEEETRTHGFDAAATTTSIAIPSSTALLFSYDRDLLRKRTLVCPICREKHQLSKIGVSALPNNFCFDTIKQQVVPKTADGEKCGNGIDSNSAVAFCYDCECCLCQQCLYSHRKMVATRKHTTVSLLEKTTNGPRRLPTCSEHGAELKLYCYDCNDVVCCECAINDPHRLHKYEYLDKVASGICKRLPELLEMMNERQEKLKDRVKLLKVDWRYYSAVNGIAAINKAFDDIVETRRRKVLADWKHKSTGIKERVKSTKHNLTKVSRAANFIKELDTTTKSDFELVTMLKPMMCSFEQLTTASSSSQWMSLFDDHNSQSVVTEGGDMNQLAAQLPKIVLLSHSSISVYTPGSGFYSSSGKDITISINTRVSNNIPLEAVTVKLSSGTTVIPTNIASSNKNHWLVEYEPLEGNKKYLLNVSIMGYQLEPRKFQYKH